MQVMTHALKTQTFTSAYVPRAQLTPELSAAVVKGYGVGPVVSRADAGSLPAVRMQEQVESANVPTAVELMARLKRLVGAVTGSVSHMIANAVAQTNLQSTLQPVFTPMVSSVQQRVEGWKKWSWDDVYLSLMRERELHERFEIDEQLIPDPQAQGAELGGGELDWHFRFISTDGYSLCIQHRGDRYVAWLEQFDSTRQPVELDIAELPPVNQARRQAMAAAVMVFVGSIWVVIEKTMMV